MIVENPSRQTVYFDAHKSLIYSDWQEFLTIDLVKESSLEGHQKNSFNFIQNPDTYNPVVGKIYPIPPRTVWDFKGVTPRLIAPSNKSVSNRRVTPNCFRKVFSKFAQRLDCSKIAIELSGGLDSSLIISIAKSIGLDPILLGFQSSRWEFRTEKVIQNIFATQASNSMLIDYELALPFAKLMQVPPHPIPNSSSLYYYGHKLIAEAANKYHSKVVFNGIGIEPFLVEPFIKKLNPYLQRKTMEDPWPNDFIFSKFGIRYLNVADISPAFNLLRSIRADQEIDLQKKWARDFFQEYLPKELTQHAYKAAFDGLFQAGLINELDDIKNLIGVAYELTKNKKLKDLNLDYLIENALQLSHQENVNLTAMLSYASWVNSLVKEKII